MRGWIRPAGMLARCLGLIAGCSGTTDPGSGLQLVIVAGNSQSATAGSVLATPLAVKLTRGATPVAGTTITWQLTKGAAQITPSSTTDANGIATAVLTLGAVGSVTVVASVGGSSTASVSFSATAKELFTPPIVATVPIPPLYGQHDTFVRDGIAFLCAWNTGVIIMDVGNGVKGGSPTHPVEISRFVTGGAPGVSDPSVHNAWWFQNPVTHEKKYLFIGQEGPGNIGESSSGNIHVLDISDLAHPQEVAFFHLDGAGTHNFWMDEGRQVLYAAYYNAGVVALDVSGTLLGDLSNRLLANVAPGGAGNTYVWGVMLANGVLFANDMLSGLWALDPVTLRTKGGGNNAPDRFGSDLWIHGAFAYTGTWGGIGRNCTPACTLGNVAKVWSLSLSGTPTLVDSVNIAGIHTVSDVQVTDDGAFLVLTAEGGDNTKTGLYVYSLAEPAHPVLVGRAINRNSLHTGTIAQIGAGTYVFAAQDPGPDGPAMVIYDITGAVP